MRDLNTQLYLLPLLLIQLKIRSTITLLLNLPDLHLHLLHHPPLLLVLRPHPLYLRRLILVQPLHKLRLSLHLPLLPLDRLHLLLKHHALVLLVLETSDEALLAVIHQGVFLENLGVELLKLSISRDFTLF